MEEKTGGERAWEQRGQVRGYLNCPGKNLGYLNLAELRDTFERYFGDKINRTG